MGLTELFETVLDKLAGDDDDGAEKEGEREHIAKKSTQELKAWADKEIASMLVMLPGDYKEQARGMLERFADKCFAKAIEKTQKIIDVEAV